MIFNLCECSFSRYKIRSIGNITGEFERGQYANEAEISQSNIRIADADVIMKSKLLLVSLEKNAAFSNHVAFELRRLKKHGLCCTRFRDRMITAAKQNFPKLGCVAVSFISAEVSGGDFRKRDLNAFNRRLALRRCVRKMMAIAYLPLAVVRQNFQLFSQMQLLNDYVTIVQV
ncbi:unnamed protein product [Mytilus coruscus]|uniref:Uncharacterized protein n=1 Tax=Mytilus coruscus TaxID=42192 RepID=A0A6J8BAD8_MYTCO|nr:unnamed protein product [Mytilus coruscus]